MRINCVTPLMEYDNNFRKKLKTTEGNYILFRKKRKGRENMLYLSETVSTLTTNFMLLRMNTIKWTTLSRHVLRKTYLRPQLPQEADDHLSANVLAHQHQTGIRDAKEKTVLGLMIVMLVILTLIKYLIILKLMTLYCLKMIVL